MFIELFCALHDVHTVRTQENGVMSRLRGIKDVFTEPRRKNEFQAVSVLLLCVFMLSLMVVVGAVTSHPIGGTRTSME